MITRLALVGCCAFFAASAPTLIAAPEDAVVKIIVNVRYPDVTRPWSKGSTLESQGTGVIIEGKRILTNAHVVLNATDVYVQARPGDEKLEAKIVAMDADVDLALLTVGDDAFFAKRPPLPRAAKMPKVPDSVVA